MIFFTFKNRIINDANGNLYDMKTVYGTIRDIKEKYGNSVASIRKGTKKSNIMASETLDEDDIVAWRKTKTGQPFPIKKGQSVKVALKEFIAAKEKPEKPENVIEIPVEVGIIKDKEIEYLEVDNITYRRIFEHLDSNFANKNLPKGYIHPAYLGDGIYFLELEPKDKYYNFKILDIEEYGSSEND